MDRDLGLKPIGFLGTQNVVEKQRVHNAPDTRYARDVKKTFQRLT